MRRSVLALALCIGLVTTGCIAIGGFFLGAGLLIQCGPMPMSADACEGGRGWGFTPEPKHKMTRGEVERYEQWDREQPVP